MNDANIVTFDVLNPKTRLDRAGPTLFQVREEPGSYTPLLLPGTRYADNREARTAAADHAKHLLKAERLLDEALNLTGLMLASLEDESDSRAMQAETALKVIQEKLDKAHTQLDKHDRRHTTLFLNHVDLSGKTNEAETN